MPKDTRADSYGILVYNDRPVADQYRSGEDIRVKFCDGTTAYVSPRDWLTNKRFVLVPKSYGTRQQIVRNWRAFEFYRHVGSS